jgi:hypothetical protein
VPSGELTQADLGTIISGLANGKRLGAFKARRLLPKERKLLLQIGTRSELQFKELPVYELKTVTDDQCDLCGQPLDNLAICIRCGNCVFCGALCPDPHSQNCLMCGNHVEGRSDDTDAILLLGAEG